jgi:hypothetical protein
MHCIVMQLQDCDFSHEFMKCECYGCNMWTAADATGGYKLKDATGRASTEEQIR